MSQLVRLEGKHTTQNAHCAVLLIGTERKLQEAEVKCMYYITANVMLSQKKTWLDQDQTWFG